MNVVACETTKAILEEIEEQVFAILIDESHDISTKDQMAVVLRFVNKNEHVIERNLRIVHVSETNSQALKKALEELFSIHGLCISKL